MAPKLRSISSTSILIHGKYRELVNQSSLDKSTTVDQTSQLAEPTTEPVKKYIKETFKESGNPPSELEVELLRILKGFSGWNYKETEDLAWLRELMADFDNVSSANLKACRDYHSDKPSKKRPWKNRTRQWLIREKKFREKENPPERKSKFGDSW